VKSTYDENLYTKKLDLTKMTKEQVHSVSSCVPPVDGHLSPCPGHSLLHTLLDDPAPLLRPFLLAHAALLYPLSPAIDGSSVTYSLFHCDFSYHSCPAAMQIKRAEKMAREIEGGASDNIHLQVRQSVSRSQRRMRG